MRIFQVVVGIGLLVSCVRMSSADEQFLQWTAFRVEDGLYHNMITAVVQARDEAVWFATFGGGISRYDGRTWRTFTTVDGLPSNTIGSLVEAEDGTLWASAVGGYADETHKGIVRLAGNRWEVVDLPDSLASIGTLSGAAPGETGLFLATDDRGILQHKDGKWHAITSEDGLASNTIRCVFRSRDGALWAAYGFGKGPIYRLGRQWPGLRPTGMPALSRFDPKAGRWTSVTGVEGLADDGVLSMAQTDDGAIWFGTWKTGVLRYDGTAWRAYTVADGLPSNHVQALAVAPDGSLWAGTPAGLARHIPSRASTPGIGAWEVFTEREGLPNNSVTSICMARDGSVWVGTREGAARYGMTGWIHRRSWVGIAGARGVKLARGADGTLWAATGEGLYRLEPMAWREVYRFADADRDLAVDLALAEDGVLWMATTRQVLRYDGRDWQKTEIPSNVAAGSILAICPTRDGGLWAGTLRGAYRFDGRGWQPYPLDVAGPVTAVLEAKENDVWFGVKDGVIREFEGKRRHYSEANGLPSGPIVEVFLDREDRTWVSSHSGVAFSNGEEWESVPPGYETMFNEVHRICQAGDGTFWLASVLDGAIHTDGTIWTRYTARSGLSGEQVWDVCEDAEGQLWFATDKGLGCYSLDREAPETFLFGPSEKVAPYQSVLVRFAGQDAWKRTPLKALLFSWRLDGGAWSPFVEQDQALLDDLGSGYHTVEGRAMDQEFNVDPTPAMQTFEVLAPVWRRPWFIAMSAASLAVLAISSGYALQKNRLWRQAQNRLIQELDSELQMAHDMQMSLLPSDPIRSDRVEFAGRCVPANHVGGDYFTYFRLDEDRRLIGFGTADVSGKGMVAAVRVMQLSGIFHYEFRAQRPLQKVLEGLHNQLLRLLDEVSFVTCCLGVLDVQQRRVWLANAAHCFPYHYSASARKVVPLQMPSLALGMVLPPGSPGGYSEAEIQMQDGDVLVLYSDGVTDLRDANGEFYDEWRLEAQILQHADQGAEALVDAVFQDLAKFKATTSQVDDVTLLVVRIPPRISG